MEKETPPEIVIDKSYADSQNDESKTSGVEKDVMSSDPVVDPSAPKMDEAGVEIEKKTDDDDPDKAGLEYAKKTPRRRSRSESDIQNFDVSQLVGKGMLLHGLTLYMCSFED